MKNKRKRRDAEELVIIGLWGCAIVIAMLLFLTNW